MVVGMRNRAKPMTPPAPTSTARTATPEPKKRTKYDELVDVLADGLFEVIMTAPPPAAIRTARRRPLDNRSSASRSSNASDPEPRAGVALPSTYSE